MNNCNYNWEKLGKLIWLRKVCAEETLEAHQQAETLSLYLAPCRLFAVFPAWAAV